MGIQGEGRTVGSNFLVSFQCHIHHWKKSGKRTCSSLGNIKVGEAACSKADDSSGLPGGGSTGVCGCSLCHKAELTLMHHLVLHETGNGKK